MRSAALSRDHCDGTDTVFRTKYNSHQNRRLLLTLMGSYDLRRSGFRAAVSAGDDRSVSVRVTVRSGVLGVADLLHRLVARGALVFGREERTCGPDCGRSKSVTKQYFPARCVTRQDRRIQIRFPLALQKKSKHGRIATKDMAPSAVSRKRQQTRYYDAGTATIAFAVDDVDAVILWTLASGDPGVGSPSATAVERARKLLERALHRM
jgi:hypothetical protein